MRRRAAAEASSGQDRVFRALLRVLPADFQAGYGREMEATFRAERRDAASGPALVSLWIGTAVSILRAAAAEHADVLTADLRHAWRSMARRRAQSLTAVSTLALGLGASITLFSVVDAVLVAPLPYQDPDRLVVVREVDGSGEGGRMGYRTFVDLREGARGLSALAAAANASASLAGDGREPERVNAARVSASYFDLLGLRPQFGRGFLEGEDRPGPARRVVVLGHALWQRRFAGDPNVVGRPLAIGEIPHTVVGVLPAVREDLVAERLLGRAELFLPLGYAPELAYACRTCRHLEILGRLAPGITADSAARELDALLARLAAEHPTEYNEPGAQAVRLADLFLGPVRPVLGVLAAGVLLLLGAACANVSNLLLLRASERAREIAVRTALGVTRSRLARQLATEALLLAVLGGGAGLLPAWGALLLVAAWAPDQVPRLTEAALDARAMGGGFTLVIACALVFGLVPLRQLVRRDSAEALHGAGRRTEDARTSRARAMLVAVNVMVAVVLLVGSGLLVRSLRRLLAEDPGFDPSRTLTAELVLSGAKYRGDDEAKNIAAAAGFFGAVLERTRALPGVEAAAAVTTLPLGGGVDGFGLHVVGRPSANPEEAPSADRFASTPGFFEALRIPLLRGRGLDERDAQGAQSVAVVNRRIAREIFPGEDAIGRQIRLGPPDAPARTIVGIAPDIRHHGLDATPGYQVYVPQAQWSWAETGMTLVVRTTLDPSDLALPLRRAVQEMDPAQPLTAVRPYDSVLRATLGTRRFATTLLGSFAASALALALVGLYGTLGVVVAQRRREIGVRIALGARAAAVRWMVVVHGLRPVLAGLVVGLGLAAISVGGLRSHLYGVAPLDPSTFAAVALLLLLFGGLACLIPAWRAARIDPAQTLRAE